tara:strand:+ start:676 stop:1080 length:405 start_codon:yes stop_codon:yes gene_type:complete
MALTNLTKGLTVDSEGGSATTNLAQGLVKVWWQFDPTNSNTTDESFNVSGIVDNGTGDTTTSFTNAFSGARDYSTAQCHAYENNGVGATVRGNGAILRAAGSLRSYGVYISATNGSATVEDFDENSWQLCGDLA